MLNIEHGRQIWFVSPVAGIYPAYRRGNRGLGISMWGVGVVSREVRTAGGGVSDGAPDSFSRSSCMIPRCISALWPPACGCPSSARVHCSQCLHAGSEVRTHESGSHPCSASLLSTPAPALACVGLRPRCTIGGIGAPHHVVWSVGCIPCFAKSCSCTWYASPDPGHGRRSVG